MELRSFLLNSISPKVFYKNILGLDEGNVICPFHKDTNPSLNVRDDGSAYCYGCRRSWRNIIDFYMQYKKVSFSGALYQLYNDFIEPIVPRKLYLTLYSQLRKGSKPYKWLQHRGIGSRTITRFLLGYDKYHNKITLPIFNEFGYCVNIRCFSYTEEDRKKFKVFNFKKGYGKSRLFPMLSLFHKEVYVFEGEMDTLLALHLGLNGITVTGGSYSWRREFSALFKDKIVYICYDNDKAGIAGSRIVAKELTNIADKVYNVLIPEKFGKDFTDYMRHRPIEAFLNLVSSARVINKMDLKDIEKLKDVDNYIQEETMIADLKPGKNRLHIIVQIEPDEK